MLNSRIKDKIYAFLSFLTIILVIGSFVAVVNFLLETNKYIFNVNEKIVKEKTIVVDKMGFENIKEKLNLKEGKSKATSQAEKTLTEEEKAPLETPLANDILTPSVSPSPSPEIQDKEEIPGSQPGRII